jgi:hypothetical protein
LKYSFNEKRTKMFGLCKIPVLVFFFFFWRSTYLKRVYFAKGEDAHHIIVLLFTKEWDW